MDLVTGLILAAFCSDLLSISLVNDLVSGPGGLGGRGGGDGGGDFGNGGNATSNRILHANLECIRNKVFKKCLAAEGRISRNEAIQILA